MRASRGVNPESPKIPTMLMIMNVGFDPRLIVMFTSPATTTTRYIPIAHTHTRRTAPSGLGFHGITCCVRTASTTRLAGTSASG